MLQFLKSALCKVQTHKWWCIKQDSRGMCGWGWKFLKRNIRRKERCEWNYSINVDIWNDDQTMMVVNGKDVIVDYNVNESAKMKKNYIIIGNMKAWC